MCLRLSCKMFISKAMKKVAVVFLGLIITISVWGQGFTGIVAGSNMAFLTGDSTSLSKRSPRYGFYGGIMRDIYIDHSTYIQYGVFFSQQGAKYKNEYYYQGLFYRDIKKLNVNYVHVPVVWKQNWDWVYTELGGYLGFTFPGLAHATWSQEIHSAESIDTLGGEYKSFGNNIRFYDVGIVLGLGYQFKINETFDMFFDIRYKPGFIKLYKGYVPYPEFASRNQVFTLSMGIIRIGKANRHRLTPRKLGRR